MAGKVTVDDEEVTYTPSGGATGRITWADLTVVEVVTTDQGPVQEDVFWVLRRVRGELTIPQSASGVPELVERLQELPGFDDYALIAAMASTSNDRFPCWVRYDT